VFGDQPEVYEQPTGTEALHFYDLETRQYSTVPGSSGLWSGRWSPDGSYIAALTIVGQELRVLDTADNRWRSLPLRRIGNMAWSPDGRFIQVETDDQGKRLSRVHLPEGRVEQVADLTNESIPFYVWTGIAPDGTPLILRNLGSSEIYGWRFHPGK
jgi:Tol biopolymer transport system component